MTNPTTPFSWQMPTSTDLVTDLPADFETFCQAVATSMADLLGGTTGQVLSKASNTDMDFTWVAQDDSNAIQNTIVDAKGDLIAASAADTPARLAVGANGESLIVDSSTATGLAYAKRGMFLLDSGTFSGASVTSASLSGSYRDLKIYIRNFLPATDATGLNVRFNGDSATNYSTAQPPGLTQNSAFTETSTQAIFNVDNAVSQGLATMLISDYANTVTYKSWFTQFLGNNSTTSTNFNTAVGWNGFYKSTSAISTVTFLPTAGNFTSGNYYIYGVA